MTFSFVQLPRMHIVSWHNEHFYVFLFKWKGPLSLLLKKYGQIEELTLLKLASLPIQVCVWEIGHQWVWKDRKWEIEQEKVAQAQLHVHLQLLVLPV